MRLTKKWLAVGVAIGFFSGIPTLSSAKSVNEKILDILLESKIDQEISGPEIPLDQDEIPFHGLRCQPDPERLQEVLKCRQIGRDMAPTFQKLRGKGDNLPNPQGSPGIGFLLSGELMVEDKKKR